MSVETDFRALLAGYSALTALVGTRIALNAAPEAASLPLVVFSATHDRNSNLDGTLAYDACTLAVQCWADGSVAADAVADAVILAVATAPAARGATVVERSTTFDPDLGADGTTLTVSWWQTS
jgi:hypothetical protein